MNREIIFRSWNKFAGMSEPFVIGSYLSNNYTGVLMQYTGLKDRNLKRIFEGDIIPFFGFKGVVSYEQQACQYWLKWKDLHGKSRFKELVATDGGDEYYHAGLEVIGNIYENPELLK